VQTLAILMSPYISKVLFSLLTKAGREIEAKLQTATSSLEVNSIISVQRLLDLMVPKCCWLDFLLQWSLKSM
jgi:hypothetical protein